MLHNIEKNTFLIIFNVVMNIRVIAERKLLLEVACSDKIKNKRSQQYSVPINVTFDKGVL